MRITVLHPREPGGKGEIIAADRGETRTFPWRGDDDFARAQREAKDWLETRNV